MGLLGMDSFTISVPFFLMLTLAAVLWLLDFFVINCLATAVILCHFLVTGGGHTWFYQAYLVHSLGV